MGFKEEFTEIMAGLIEVNYLNSAKMTDCIDLTDLKAYPERFRGYCEVNAPHF
jgi:hypothetical protein